MVCCREHLSVWANSVDHINHRPNGHHSNMKTRHHKLLDKVCFPPWDETANVSNSLEPRLLSCTGTHWCTCSIRKVSTLIVRCVDEHLSPMCKENVKCFSKGEAQDASVASVGNTRVDPEVYQGSIPLRALRVVQKTEKKIS